MFSKIAVTVTLTVTNTCTNYRYTILDTEQQSNVILNTLYLHITMNIRFRYVAPLFVHEHQSVEMNRKRQVMATTVGQSQLREGITLSSSINHALWAFLVLRAMQRVFAPQVGTGQALIFHSASLSLRAS